MTAAVEKSIQNEKLQDKVFVKHVQILYENGIRIPQTVDVEAEKIDEDTYAITDLCGNVSKGKLVCYVDEDGKKIGCRSGIWVKTFGPSYVGFSTTKCEFPQLNTEQEARNVDYEVPFCLSYEQYDQYGRFVKGYNFGENKEILPPKTAKISFKENIDSMLIKSLKTIKNFLGYNQ